LHAESEVVIAAPLAHVWEYNSHNEYATQWSVFFRSIEACPVADCPNNAFLQPTDIGYIRRALRGTNERGIFWDEETLAVFNGPTGRTKYIRSFNFHGYPGTNRAEYLVEQDYEVVDATHTRLRFVSRIFDYEKLSRKLSYPWYLYWLNSGRLVVPKTADTFRKNLENIKAAIEQGPNYKRIYPFEPWP
jgi:hypothetical protein